MPESDEQYNVSEPDMLLECLQQVCKHYGRSKSRESLKAGLAYDEKMGPEMFCEAAERLGLKSKIVKKSTVKELDDTTLPAVLIMQGERNCLCLSKNKKTAKVFMPETGGEVDIPLKDIQNEFTGYAILVHPEARFSSPEVDDEDDPDRHWFWSLINQNKGVYGLAMIGALFINLFALTSPLFIMNVYDRVIPNNAIETGWILGLGALTVYMFDLILRILRGSLIDMAGRRIDVIAGRRIYDQVLNMKSAYRPPSSGVFANMLRDFDSVREFFTSATITVLVDLPFSLFFLFIIYSLAGNIAFILLGLILSVAVVGFLIQFRLKHLVRKSVKSSATKHGLLVETIHGLETLKAISADGRFRAKYTKLLGQNAQDGQKSRFWSALGVNIASFLQQTASIIVVLAGMYMVRDGDLSIGGLIAAVILGGRAIAPIGQLANIITKYHQAGGALKVLDKFMKQPVERPENKDFLNRPDLEGSITFEHVSFSYPSNKQAVLRDVSFSIKPGEKVAIVGPIGSGKSTITRLMMGLYEPSDGTVLVDKTDYRQIDPADLRRNIGYIAQDVFLFSGTIRDNIAASVPGISEEAILEAAKIAGAHEFIARHPMGYDAPVGEHGSTLSGGQKQVIAMARAIVLNPNMIVCDEPTNAMGMQAEKAFISYVQRMEKDKTLVLVTHKPSLIPLVERVILMDQGKIVMDDKRDVVLKALQAGGSEQ